MTNTRSVGVNEEISVDRNGVTGCGLMSGVLLVVERLQEQQVVDVYRTVVHLRRARAQFITSQVLYFTSPDSVTHVYFS